MLIKEQRGKRCPQGYDFNVGDLSCEECDHWKFKTTNRPHRDKNGSPYHDTLGKPIMSTDEFCELLLKEETEE